MSPRFRSVAAFPLFLSMVAGSARAGTAQWEFNGSLASSTGQLALTPTGYPGVAGAPGVTYENAMIQGAEAQVARITRGTALAVLHGFPSNGGGGYLNQYTIILDASFPGIGDWISLYQTNEAYDDTAGHFDLSDSNDGDLFIDPDGHVGISGVYGGTLTVNTWYRIALVVDLVAGTLTTYADGVQIQQLTGQGLDGRFALYTSTDPDPYDWFFLFADETEGAAEMGEVLVNSFQFRDTALAAADVAALGGATALGIGVLPQGCGEVYFAENFNNVADDAALDAAGWQRVDANAPLENATWTLGNPGGRRNPPTSNGTASTGKFAISDSDAADNGNTVGSGMSHDLITPSFSTVGATVVWLHAGCNAQLNDNGDAVFDVDVSTNNGGAWTNVFRRVSPARTQPPAASNANADGFFGELALDLSSVAANQASVRIRFRHFEPTDDWWVALDDILVSCDPAPSGGNCTILANQTFAAGLGAMTAVSNTGNTGSETWSTTDKGNRYTAGAVSPRGVNRLNHPNAAKEFVIMESGADPDPAEDEYLRTPVLNCSSYQSVFLHFKSETVVDDPATQEVLLSVDGGATFPTKIFRYNVTGAADNGLFDGGEEPFYGEHVFSVPQAAGAAQVVFAFHYKSPGNIWYWALDDIAVTGGADVCDPRDCGLRSFSVSYDAANNRVNGSWASLPGDAGFRVLEGGRTVAELGGGATSFVDNNPPKGSTSAVYILECLVENGAQPPVLVVDRQCSASAISTFACPAGLSCRVDESAKDVHLAWAPGVNLDATSYELRRDGVVIATPALGDASFTDSPPLVAGQFGVFNYELGVVGADAADCALQACRAIVSPGNVCFADDFEGYGNDVDFELAGYFRVDEVPDPVMHPGEDATWTVLNPGGRSRPPTFDGKPSTGRFAISDSDFASGDNGTPGTGNSNDLWSPSFSTTGKTVVWLHMDCSAQLNDNGVVVFDIDVSTNGGGSWTNVFRRVAPSRTQAPPLADRTNADGFFGRLDVDLSAVAANKPDVKFRIRSFEPSDDWWIAVDNIVVDDVPPLAGGSISIFQEDFEAGITLMNVVSAAGNSGTTTWNTDDPCARWTEAVTGRGVNRLDKVFAILDSDCDPDPAQDEYLVTPALDCSTLGDVFLAWQSEIVATTNTTQEVLLSIDGGDTYLPEPVFSYNNGGLFDSGEEPFYARRVLSVPRAAGQANVAFAFHYVSGGDEWWWAIDNVEVTGTEGCPAFTASIEGDTEASTGGTVHLTSTTDASAPATYAWTVESGPGEIVGSSTGAAVDVRGTADGEVVVRLEVRDSCGKPKVASHTIAFTTGEGGTQKPFDENQDGKMDISDAVAVLNFLFTGSNPTLPCGDGLGADPANIQLLDANGDNKVDLSDPVRELGFLFLGNPRPVSCVDDNCPCIIILGCPNGPGPCN